MTLRDGLLNVHDSAAYGRLATRQHSFYAFWPFFFLGSTTNRGLVERDTSGNALNQRARIPVHHYRHPTRNLEGWLVGVALALVSSNPERAIPKRRTYIKQKVAFPSYLKP
jgi:hypothetical protein